MRVLVNISEGYNDNGNEVLPDRCMFYTELVSGLLDELRQIQKDLDQNDLEVDKMVGLIDLELMTDAASFTFD